MKIIYCDRSKRVKNATAESQKMSGRHFFVRSSAMNLSQTKSALKQLNLKSLAMEAGLKFSGCPTSADSHFLIGISITLLISCLSLFPSELLDKIHDPSIKKIYDYYSGLTPRDCDIGEHFPLLKELAYECPRVTEIGLGLVISTWAILQGLIENPGSHRSYLGIDIAQPPIDNMALAQSGAEKNGISFRFQRANDLYIDIEPTDLLFIDSMHTYCHLTFELETFSPKVRKFIAMHDTSEPWGNRNDDEYRGNYSEYPAHYNRSKRGLWPAVEDFLNRHSEWTLQERHLNCHGFTILKRIDKEEK